MYNAKVKTETTDLPFVVSSTDRTEPVESWLTEHKNQINDILTENKAILFRGFKVDDGLNGLSSCLFDELLNYTYRSTPRVNVSNSVYSSTEYPKNMTILQHCENAYQRNWPMKLVFHCVNPAYKGGSTPLADMIRVTNMISSEIKDEFEKRKVKYVRNFRPGVDLPWQEVFGTSDRKAVEAYCNNNDIQYEWLGDQLRTSQVCQSFATHPVTGQNIWFNQAHLFHVSALDEASQNILLTMFKEEDLPRMAYFGDGTAIDPDTLQHIRSTFQQNTISFDWQKNDVLLIDNMLVSHGRTPYEGPRKITVCMAEPYYPM
jgi:alpha-ketoglutarate-dependent taurine dioxygenase